MNQSRPSIHPENLKSYNGVVEWQISHEDIWSIVRLGEQVTLHPWQLFKVHCILQTRGMIFRTCAEISMGNSLPRMFH